MFLPVSIHLNLSDNEIDTVREGSFRSSWCGQVSDLVLEDEDENEKCVVNYCCIIGNTSDVYHQSGVFFFSPSPDTYYRLTLNTRPETWLCTWLILLKKKTEKTGGYCRSRRVFLKRFRMFKVTIRFETNSHTGRFWWILRYHRDNHTQWIKKKYRYDLHILKGSSVRFRFKGF